MVAMQQKRESGFTLPELLVVSVVLLIFIGVFLGLVRPQSYDVERRNAERQLGLAQIMQAVARYHAKNGTLPPHITAVETEIATGENEQTSSLCTDLVPEYAPDLPKDPTAGLFLFDGSCASEEQLFTTGYYARLKDGGWVVLSAPAAEDGATITIERWLPLL